MKSCPACHSDVQGKTPCGHPWHRILEREVDPKEPSLEEMLGTLLGHARLCHGCKLRGQAHDLERLRTTLAARLQDIMQAMPAFVDDKPSEAAIKLRALATEIRGRG